MGVRNVPRRVSRNLAFQVLYGQEFLHATSLEELSRAFREAPRQAGQEEAEDGGFAWELVEGVWSKRSELDEQIRRYARNWRLERVGRVELTLLRLALYERLSPSLTVCWMLPLRGWKTALFPETSSPTT